MERKPDNTDTGSSDFLTWIEEKGEVPKSETVAPHTPPKKASSWSYTLREGGVKYPVNMPNTEEQIAKVKQQLSNPINWKFYQVSPYGGPRAYTLVMCFPPFDPLRVAEVFLPTGEVWRSTTRRFHKL